MAVLLGNLSDSAVPVHHFLAHVVGAVKDWREHGDVAHAHVLKRLLCFFISSDSLGKSNCVFGALLASLGKSQVHGGCCIWVFTILGLFKAHGVHNLVCSAHFDLG